MASSGDGVEVWGTGNSCPQLPDVVPPAHLEGCTVGAYQEVLFQFSSVEPRTPVWGAGCPVPPGREGAVNRCAESGGSRCRAQPDGVRAGGERLGSLCTGTATPSTDLCLASCCALSIGWHKHYFELGLSR